MTVYFKFNFFSPKNIKILSKSKKNIEFEYSNKEIFFKCNIVFTGKNNGTGGRIKIAYNELRLNEDIIMTYGDGLSDININKLLKFHRHNKSLVTLTAVRPKIKYGFIKIRNKKMKPAKTVSNLLMYSVQVWYLLNLA